MENKYFNRAFTDLIEIEGERFTDDPDDSGGGTKWGITERLAREYGYKNDMRDMSKTDAKNIYNKAFWIKAKLNYINDYEIVFELFEQIVNLGNFKRSCRWLQEALNVLNNKEKHWTDLVVDGLLGPTTSSILSKSLKRNNMKERILKLLNCEQAIFYKTLVMRREKDEKFIGGWLDHRIGLNKA